MARYQHADPGVTASGAYERCAEYVGLLRLHDPDPYYVRYLFSQYLRAADAAINEIFAGADTDFGLFARGRNGSSGTVTRDSFAARIRDREKARSGSTPDALASEFLRWYDNQYESQWHHPPGSYPHAMRIARDAARPPAHAYRRYPPPDIRIMMMATDTHPGDPVYELDMTGLTAAGGRLKSRQALHERVRRRAPVFLEMVNHKRRRYGEPAAGAADIRASAFAVFREHIGGPDAPYMTVNIPRATGVYATTISRMRAESALFIRGLLSSPRHAATARTRGRISGAARPS